MFGGMSGIQLAREAKARWPSLNILLTSGFPEKHGFTAKHLIQRLRVCCASPIAKGELAQALLVASRAAHEAPPTERNWTHLLIAYDEPASANSSGYLSLQDTSLLGGAWPLGFGILAPSATHQTW